MPVARLTSSILLLALALVIGISVRDQLRHHPENLPWKPLSLAHPVGMFTLQKLGSLTEDAGLCRSLLADAGVAFAAQSPITSGECTYGDGVLLQTGGALATRWQPARLSVACPVAAALTIWERDVVRRAAIRHFGRPVIGIDHLGSFNCRRIAGSASWSEHATADAIDIAAFRIEGGTRVAILAGWDGTPAEAAFLREVRDGACGVFGTVLSPDYNEAHADHLHLDQARRNFGVCR